jgi:hypothetical protein
LIFERAQLGFSVLGDCGNGCLNISGSLVCLYSQVVEPVDANRQFFIF